LDIIVTSVLPLFSVILIGFGAGRLRIVDEAGVRTLVTFVFCFAMPALIFRLMATGDVMAVEGWPVVLAYFTAQLPIFLGGLMIGGWLFRQSMSEMVIQAFGSSFSNGVLLGLPLVLSLHGERAGVPGLLIIMLDIAIFSAVTLLLEIARVEGGAEPAPGVRRRLGVLALSVLRNPLIAASVLGVAFGLTALPLPGALDKTLSFLGQAGPPAGLFALGATLGQRRLGGQAGPVGAMIVLKLLLHPLLAWVVATRLFVLDPVAAHVALLFAAGPVGANVYVFAAHYRAAVATSATAILLSTAASLFTLSLLTLLLAGQLP
jgi:hypothetical protein